MDLKLSEILYRLKSIEQFENENSFDNINRYADCNDKNLKDINEIDYNRLKLLEDNLIQSFKEYKNFIDNSKQQLYSNHLSNKEEYQNLSDEIWQLNSEKMTFDEHLEWAKLFTPSLETIENFSNHIKKFTGWKDSGLILGAKDTELIHSFPGINPFYIVENYKEYLELQKNKVDQTTVRRTLWYSLEEINLLPDNAIGIIAIYNEFPFIPWRKLSQILTILSSKIHPEGVIIFNYNDCNTLSGLESFENRSMIYTTSDMFDELMISQNFTQIDKYNSLIEPFNVLTYRKNGNFKSLKMLPSLATIHKVNPIEHKEKLEQIRKLIKK